MKRSGSWFMVIGVLLLAVHGFAQKQNLVERIYEGSSKDKNPVVAKRQIQDEATQSVSEALVKEIIGEAKFLRNKALIEKKIFRNAARYIPFSRPGTLKVEGEQFKMPVTLKISVDDLQAMLLENGLFYESDATPSVLPAVRWFDKVRTQSWQWWYDQDELNKPFLVKQNKNLENSLKAAFSKSQFYVVRPSALKYGDILIPTFRTDRWSSDDLQSIAKRLGVQILVDGEITLTKSAERSEAVVIQLNLSATQIQNGRSIAEVSRQVETEAGPFEAMVDRRLKDLLETAAQDLSSQVFDAWSKGTIGSSLYRLTIRGRLPVIGQETFKEQFRTKVHEVKNIRERIIANDSLVFELDSLLPPSELAKKVPEMEVSGFKLTLDSSNESELIYRLQKGN